MYHVCKTILKNVSNNKNLNVQEVKFVCSLAEYGSSLTVNEEVIV